MDVHDEVWRLSTALGRRCVVEERGTNIYRVAQSCPLCDCELGLWVSDARDIGPPTLQRRLFAQYDEHRCRQVETFDTFQRAERALVTAAERIAQVDDPDLRARVELEADRMAAEAQRLLTRIDPK